MRIYRVWFSKWGYQSHIYKHPKQSARLWVEGGGGVKECIIIKIHKTPQYRSLLVDNVDFPAHYPSSNLISKVKADLAQVCIGTYIGPEQ